MSEYIKIDDLDDTVLRLNNDGWEITRNEHKLISNVLYEMPLYSFPDREKGEWIRHKSKLANTEDSRECSNCHVWLNWDMPRNSFCPNCGADMRGKDNETDN